MERGMNPKGVLLEMRGDSRERTLAPTLDHLGSDLVWWGGLRGTRTLWGGAVGGMATGAKQVPYSPRSPEI